MENLQSAKLQNINISKMKANIYAIFTLEYWSILRYYSMLNIKCQKKFEQDKGNLSICHGLGERMN